MQVYYNMINDGIAVEWDLLQIRPKTTITLYLWGSEMCP